MFTHIRATATAVLAALAMAIALPLSTAGNAYSSEGVRISADQGTASVISMTFRQDETQGAQDGVRIS
jgi:hypothetical protein